LHGTNPFGDLHDDDGNVVDISHYRELQIELNNNVLNKLLSLLYEQITVELECNLLCDILYYPTKHLPQPRLVDKILGSCVSKPSTKEKIKFYFYNNNNIWSFAENYKIDDASQESIHIELKNLLNKNKKFKNIILNLNKKLKEINNSSAFFTFDN
jgi:hypothetical protein